MDGESNVLSKAPAPEILVGDRSPSTWDIPTVKRTAIQVKMVGDRDLR